MSDSNVLINFKLPQVKTSIFSIMSGLAVKENSRFEFTPSNGTYFQLLNFKNITKESDYNFAMRLTKEQKIASIPISVFDNENYDTKVLRFCFAKTDETLIKAA